MFRKWCAYVFTQRIGSGFQSAHCGASNYCTSAPLLTLKNAHETDSKVEGETGQEELFGSQHPYHRLFPWKSKKEFVETLLQCIVHNSDGLVVINKPFGVGVLNFPNKDRSGGSIQDKIHLRGIGSTQYTLQDAVPILRNALNQPNLVLVKSTEKMSSGLAVFATDDKAAEKFQTQLYLSRATTQENPVYRYHVITKYTPHSEKSSFRERVGIWMKSSPLSDVRQPLIEREIGKNMVKRKEIVPIRVYLETLGKGLHDTALLEIQTSNVKYNFLRVYCADLVVPILGDHMFSCRVRSVMGVPTKIDPSHALPHSSDQELSMPLLKTLNLQSPEDSIKVPPHIHLHSYTVRNFFGRGKHLKLEAPYHHYFQWTCEQLRLLYV